MRVTYVASICSSSSSITISVTTQPITVCIARVHHNTEIRDVVVERDQNTTTGSCDNSEKRESAVTNDYSIFSLVLTFTPSRHPFIP